MAKKGLGDKGFSLLELLIGITMLAIIVVPIIHAFLTSSSTSTKSMEVQNQTTAAQNVLESYEATDISSVINNVKDHIMPFGSIASASYVFVDEGGGVYSAVTSGSTEAADGPRYRICLSNVTANDKTYDAVLTVDAAKYSDRNGTGIVDYQPMDAVYIQPEPADESNPDILAAKDFASQAQIDSGNEVPYTYFLDKMTRKITVNIQKIGGQTGIISCTALFHYQAHYSYTVTDSSKTPAVVTPYEKDYTAGISNDFYSGSYTESENGINGLYFFFYPNTYADAIEIVNRDNIDMSIYLVRQGTVDGVYNPVINLREKNDPSATPPHAQLYYNRAQYSFKYYIGYPNAAGYSDYWYNTFAFDGTLIGTPAQNRLYGVTVELYKAGSIQPDGSISGTVLAAFDASSLE